MRWAHRPVRNGPDPRPARPARLTAAVAVGLPDRGRKRTTSRLGAAGCRTPLRDSPCAMRFSSRGSTPWGRGAPWSARLSCWMRPYAAAASCESWMPETVYPTPEIRHSTAPAAASRHQGSCVRPARSTPMLPASAHAHGPVLVISPTTTTRPARGRSQPRRIPSRRSSRNTTSAPRPTSHGIQERPANGHSSSAAASSATPAAPRGERKKRRQRKRGLLPGGWGPCAGGWGRCCGGWAGSGTAGGAGCWRDAGSHGGGVARRGSIAARGYRPGGPWPTAAAGAPCALTGRQVTCRRAATRGVRRRGRGGTA